ncbi:MAG: hypothetical protein JEZ03_07075, partial [Bacteroidales bacterium]|nr:hypothetical protein [Bacteroidales bacterium]
DRFKDYQTETLLEKAIKNRKTWGLEIYSQECLGTFSQSYLKIIPKRKKIIAKYITCRNLKDSRRHKKCIKRFTLTEQDIKELIIFEKQVILMNRPDGGCTSSRGFTLSFEDKEIEIVDNSCSGFNANKLLEKLRLINN